MNRHSSLINLIHLVIIAIVTRSDGVASTFQDGLFSTKTPYFYIENDNISITVPPSECKVKQINLVNRHGHRYPSSGNMKRFQALSIKLNKGTVPPGLNFTLPWRVPFVVEENSYLTGVGELELYHIGRRLHERFPRYLASKQYSPRWYSFVSTHKKRTAHSASSLAAGVFDGNASIDKRIQPIALDIMPPDPNDRLLRFYDACDNYRKQIGEKQSKEYVLFQNEKEVRAVIKKIEKKINVQNLTYVDVKMIFVGCSHEIAMFGGSMNSGLCSLLDEDDRMVMEYGDDIEKFYSNANLHEPLTYKIACPLLKEITKTLTESAQNQTESIGIFRSTHSQAMLMMYTLLGLNKQLKPLEHDNYEQMKNRTFRSSVIAPFSANFYFVLYECGEDSTTTKIQLYWNERLQRIPCCSNEVDCDFNVFLKCYEDYVANCDEDFEKLCKNSAQSNVVLSRYNKLFLICLFFIKAVLM